VISSRHPVPPRIERADEPTSVETMPEEVAR